MGVASERLLSVTPAGPGRVRLVGAFETSPPAAHLGQPAGRLIALLALKRRWASRETLAYTLWPDVPEGAARSSLRTALWSVGVARASLLEEDPLRIRIRADVVVDVEELTTQARLGWDIASAGLDPLIQQYESELLPGWYDDWTTVARDEWTETRVRALEDLALGLSRTGRHGDAVRAAMAAVAIDPERDTSRQRLIAAHAAEGNLARAVREFRCYRDLLWVEYGLRPSAALLALMAALGIADPSAMP